MVSDKSQIKYNFVNLPQQKSATHSGILLTYMGKTVFFRNEIKFSVQNFADSTSKTWSAY